MKKLITSALLLFPAHLWAAWGNVEDTDFGFTVAGNLSQTTGKITTLNCQDGDALVVVLGLRDTGRTVTPPSGYMLVTSEDTGQLAVFIYERECDGTEVDVNWTWTGGNSESVIWTYLFQGDYAGGTIVDQTAFSESGGLDDSPEITPTDQPSTVFAAAHSWGDDGTLTPPSGMTITRSFFHGSSEQHYVSAYEDYTSTNPTGTMSWVNFVGTTQHYSFNVLNAGVGGGGGSASVNDSTPVPGTTVSVTCGSNFASAITTLTTPEGDTISAESGATVCNADFIIPALAQYTSTGSMDDTQWSSSGTWTVGDGVGTENITMQIDPPTTGDFGNIAGGALPGDEVAPVGYATNDDYFCRFTEGSGVINDSMVPLWDTTESTLECRTYDESLTVWTDPLTFVLTVANSECAELVTSILRGVVNDVNLDVTCN